MTDRSIIAADFDRARQEMPEPSIGEIQAAVADAFSLSLQELLSERRSRAISAPRQVAMWLAVRLTGRSLPVIGKQFRRDHTTVMHAVEATERRIFEADTYGRAALSLHRRFTQADARQMELGGV